MMTQGLELLAVGMGTVFAFLSLLALAMEAAGRILGKVMPDPEATTSKSPPAVSNAAQAQVAVAIAAAHRFREGGGQ